ncbi:peptidase E [Pseudalgibacter alginicilyticus]|uniref:Peptidase E n=1 Tax=Pseudalgibacter alginicilyticus TaxID=1736674 RepID=A0A0P0DB46_9FLAO|nr:DUF6702 family protein [Pseudalgibacter alginicilyticus]ALJ06138.1 peptidase E [Pseudalgibacter alginicilyticus]
MKYLRFFIVVFFPLLAFTTVHKYYISVTEINFIQERKSVQITSRIFIDDFESLLRERYDKSITLAVNSESKTTEQYIEKYLKQKMNFKINGKEVNFDFIGKEYDRDVMICYLEITGVKSISTFEVSNAVLFDLFEDQKNIIKTKINSQQKSHILILQKDKILLSYN